MTNKIRPLDGDVLVYNTGTARTLVSRALLSVGRLTDDVGLQDTKTHLRLLLQELRLVAARDHGEPIQLLQ